MSPASWERARRVAVAHLGLSLLVQLQCFVFYLLPDEGPRAGLRFLAAFPFLQLEHVGVSLLLGLVAGRAWGWTPGGLGLGRWGAQLLLLAANLWLVLDQTAYAVFFDHINLSQDESRTRDLLAMLHSSRDSILAQLDWRLAGPNLATVAALSGWVRGRRGPWRARRPPPALLGAWLALSLGCGLTLEAHNLEHHPFLSLARSAWPRAAPPPITLAPAEFREPLQGEARAEPAEDARLREALARLQARSRPPDLLIVMLESVGAKQLLPEGEPSPARTPTLARLIRDGLLFDSVYTTFPGTVRSLLGVHTGGETITWGSVWEELEHPYAGPNLVGVLRDRGYRTGLFSDGDMNFETLAGFMAGLGFDHVEDAGRRDAAWKQAHGEHAWGVRDGSLLPEALAWMEARRAAGEPFCAEYVTVSTHHPYPPAPGHVSPFAGREGLEAKYLHALHHADAVLGRLLEQLAARGLSEDLLLVVYGDHGEAFGRWHPRNHTHKNRLYEENVRSFLLLATPGRVLGPARSRRVASTGDLLPTLARALGGRLPPVPGQSLWPGDYRLRSVFFHKNAHPEQWGLRDGRWKFIARKAGDPHSELYDLERDPHEQENLAEAQPERVQAYARRCAAWLAHANESFRARLSGYRPETPGLQPEELSSYGPKRLAFGVRDAADAFVRRERLHPSERPTVYGVWVAYPRDTTVRFAWEAPSGKVHVGHLRVRSDWSRTWLDYSGPLPLEAGTWTVTLFEGRRELLSGQFQVSPRAKPFGR